MRCRFPHTGLVDRLTGRDLSGESADLVCSTVRPNANMELRNTPLEERVLLADISKPAVAVVCVPTSSAFVMEFMMMP